MTDQINSIADLDALLGGNTSPEPATTPPATEPQPTEPAAAPIDVAATEPEGGGGDPNLEPPAEPAQPAADGGEAERARQNAAFAKMRAENAQLQKTLNQLAQALKIEETDPVAKASKLLQLANEKLAKESSLPVEVFNELNQTKEELAVVRRQQNIALARDKFINLKTTYELSDQELQQFAKQLDEQGIAVVDNPDGVDLEYHYYKLNRNAIEQKRIAAAVQAALTKSNTADQKGSTPSKQSGKPSDPAPEAKVNNVAALNALFDGK